MDYLYCLGCGQAWSADAESAATHAYDSDCDQRDVISRPAGACPEVDDSEPNPESRYH